MEISWTGTVANVRGSWVRPATLWGLFAVPLMVAIMLGITSVGAAPVLAQRVPAAAASPPGTGLAWGDNADSQLGDGTTTNSSTPVVVDLPAGTTITAVAAGQGHSLAVTSTGTVLAWGANSSGQLGDGTTTPSSTPVSVDLPAGTTITAVAAGDRHSLAVTSTGTVLAWGLSLTGQLGDGTTTNSSTPVAVDLPAGTTITAVAAGNAHSLALTSTGTMLAWGANSSGQLGDGTTTPSSTPIAVDLPTATTITAIAASSSSHSLAVTSTGTMLAWGANFTGQLGNGTTTPSSTPIAVDLPAGTTITTVAAGQGHSLALTSTGTMLAWGGNGSGQLGDGSTTTSNIPIAVDLPAGTTITAVAAGAGHSLALTSTGTILAWGYNASGQLGDGTNSNSSTPIAVDLPADTTTTAVTGGSFHSLAIVPSASTSTTTLQVSPPNPTPDQPVTLTATATCTGSTPTGTVTFLDGTTVLGTEPLSGNPTATATLTVARLAPGTHRIQARYNGDSNCPASTSNSTTVTVPEPTVPKPTIPVTGTSLPTILTAGILLTLTGTALTLATRRRRPTHRP
ncbi:RCC1 domain-containing protein [Salinispora oceanensis]|uniref:RCC1 domain-containing protein n=1 Tax=Salinispora oceanensis TaxID=1050199 RepID=UPI0003722EDC|nr:Ig-like domain repeat protein [Salinispora oceanensis]